MNSRKWGQAEVIQLSIIGTDHYDRKYLSNRTELKSYNDTTTTTIKLSKTKVTIIGERL